MIPAATFAFLRGLAANNEKAWFEANRGTYDDEVRAPLAELAAAVTTELTRRALPLEGDAKRSMFRIHRDTRFSKNKSPYKTNVGLVWYRQGGSKSSPGILYCHLDPAGCFAAVGFHHVEPEVLDSIREHIRVHPDRFAAMRADMLAAGLPLDEGGMLSRMPKGFEDLKGSPVEGPLRMKNLIVHRALPMRTVQGRTLPRTLAALAADAMPLLRFGWAAVDEVTRA